MNKQKLTPKQKEIVKAMRKGSKLILKSGVYILSDGRFAEKANKNSCNALGLNGIIRSENRIDFQLTDLGKTIEI